MKPSGSILGVVTVNDKGQVVIPADARNTLNIQPSDKLLVMVNPAHDAVILVKPDGLEAYARQMLEQVNNVKDSIREGRRDSE